MRMDEAFKSRDIAVGSREFKKMMGLCVYGVLTRQIEALMGQEM